MTHKPPTPAKATDATIFGVSVGLPAEWRDVTVHAFLGPPVPWHRPTTPPRPTIHFADLGAVSLDEVIAKNPAPKSLPELSVLFEGKKPSGSGEYFERVVRFADETDGGAIQQSFRLMLVRGHVYALSVSSPAFAFESAYNDFTKMVSLFISPAGLTGATS